MLTLEMHFGLEATRRARRAARRSRFTRRWPAACARARSLRSRIVALVLFVALASYSPDDPGFSFTGSAGPVHNRIGVDRRLARRRAVLPVRPAGVPAAGDARPSPPWALQRGRRPRAALAHQHRGPHRRVRAGAAGELRARDAALAGRVACRQTAGGVRRRPGRQRAAAWLDFLGATLSDRRLDGGMLAVAFFGVSWFTVMDRLGARLARHRAGCATRWAPREDGRRARRKPGPQGGGGDRAEEVRDPRRRRASSRRRRRGEERAGRAGAAGAAVRSAEGQRAAAAEAAR